MRVSLFSILLWVFFPIGAVAMASVKPNIVYILVDNWGWGDIGVQGGTVPTPRIDQLAAEGLRLTNFNVQNQCTPTRSAIHTGRLPIRSGTQKVPAPGEPQGMAPWEYTIAELLSDAGYATAMFGKWHIGDKDGRLPNDQGYDEWYGTKESAMEASYTSTPQFDPEVFRIPYIWAGVKGEPSYKVKEINHESRATLDDEITEKTASFIRARAAEDKPFFIYVALTQIHPPFLPQPGFEGKSGSGAYADIQMQVDHNVGRIIDALKEAGIEESTILILTGDNAAGEPYGEAVRIPTDRPYDGVDQSDFILGQQERSNREHIVTYVGDRVFSVKWRSLKVHFFTAEGTFAPIVEHTFPKVYDIKNDPGETRELWSSEGYAHLWVMQPVMSILGELAVTMQKYPNIQPGEDFEGYGQ